MPGYVKLDPTGNITILVTDPVARDRQAALAAQLMVDPTVGGEQVGYLEPAEAPEARARLQMMGGEFCGNASISTAAYLAMRDGIRPGETREIPLEVSGCKGVLQCGITALTDGYEGTVRMPSVSEIRSMTLSYRGDCYDVLLVRMEGIAHFILKERILRDDRAERMLREWQDKVDEEAVGLLQWDETAGFMRPLVLVKSTGTLVWETGCGSGSTAIGVMKAMEAGDGETETAVSQPGGVLKIRTLIREGRPEEITLTGKVRILNEGRKE